MEKTIWDLLQEPLEAKIYIRTNSGFQPLNLVCPDRTAVEELESSIPKPEVPVKEELEGTGKNRKKVKVLDPEDDKYKKAVEARDVELGMRLIDMSLKDKPAGDLEQRLSVYKKLPNPVVQHIVISIQYLLAHEIPPTGLPESPEEEEVPGV